MNKAVTMKSGQTYMQRCIKPLLAKIEAGEIDSSFIITHRVSLEEAPQAYKTFREKRRGHQKDTGASKWFSSRRRQAARNLTYGRDFSR